LLVSIIQFISKICILKFCQKRMGKKIVLSMILPWFLFKRCSFYKARSLYILKCERSESWFVWLLSLKRPRNFNFDHLSNIPWSRPKASFASHSKCCCLLLIYFTCYLDVSNWLIVINYDWLKFAFFKKLLI